MTFLCKDTDSDMMDNPVKSEYENVTPVMPENPVMSLRCRDIGMECSFEAHGSTRHGLMREFIEHAESTHNMPVLSAEIIFKVHNAITKH